MITKFKLFENKNIDLSELDTLTKIKEYLIDGGDINQQDELGNTILMYLLDNRNDIASFVVKIDGIDVNLKNNNGESHLSFCDYDNASILLKLDKYEMSCDDLQIVFNKIIYFAFNKYKYINLALKKIFSDGVCNPNEILSIIGKDLEKYVENIRVDFPELYKELLLYQDLEKFNI